MAARKTSPKKQAPKAQRPNSKVDHPEFDEDADLSPAQVRELEKRIKDLKDCTRFLLASTLGPSFVLYYNVSEDTYGWNDPTHATLFKRRKAAQAIQQLLGDKDSIVECSVDKKGQLVKKSLSVPSKSRKTRSAKSLPKKSPKKSLKK